MCLGEVMNLDNHKIRGRRAGSQFPICGILDEALLQRFFHGFGAGMHVQFFINIFDMRARFRR